MLKGVGPFAVALYRGAATLGDFVAPPTPPAGAAVREVSAEQSRALFEQIVQISTVYHGPVTQVAGSQRNVNTGGGAYVEGDLRQQGVFVSGGTFGGPVIGAVSGGTLTFGAGTPSATPAVALPDALARIREAAAQAQQRGDADTADELQRIALDLAAALRADEAGDAERRRARLNRAQHDLDSLAQSQPDLSALAELLHGVG